MKSKRFLITILCFLSLATLIAQPGSLDEDFGTDGIVRLSMGANNHFLNAMAVQQDGKIIAGGAIWPNAILIRFTSTGEFDSTFGEDGIVFSDFGFDINFFNAIVLQPDGKIVVAAHVGMNFSNDQKLVIARYNKDGTIDNTFGDNGFVIAETGFLTSIVRSIVIQPDDKIVVTTRVSNSDFDRTIIVARFHTDGQLDVSFGNNGLKLVHFGEEPELPNALMLQADGKIIVAGTLERPESNTNDFALARLNADGSFDASFDNDGIVITQISMESNTLRDLIIQSDDKIVAVGAIASGTEPSKVALVRYHIDGTLDASFGNEGIVLTQLQNRNVGGNSCLLQPDGKIVVGGSIQNSGSGNNFLLVRYTPEGLVDDEFGDSGIVNTEISTSTDRINDLALQVDGKIVAAGDVSLVELVLTQYLSDLDVGTLDFSVVQNSMLVYPNPIKETGSLKYTLLNQDNISLQLFDFNGKLLRAYIKNENRGIGEHNEVFAFPLDTPPGPYVLVLSGANGKIAVKVFRH